MHVISCSLNPNSNSRKLAQYITKQNPELNFIDLQDYTLPHCNGGGQSSYGDPQVKKLHDILLSSKGILFCSPIYNWDVSSHFKNLIELLGTPYKDVLTGKVWQNKVVAYVGACGTSSSFLAPLGILNSLMVDFEAVIVPKYALVPRGDFENGKIKESVLERIDQIVDKWKKMTELLKQA